MTFNYGEACEYITDAAKLGSRPGLERIRQLCALLGDPQNDLRFIHVAGTNGKGSTCAMIANALVRSHIKTGMYYSPAITCLEDHFMIDGEPIARDEYAACVSAVADANGKLEKETGESATQFELETALAFYYFRKNRCDAVVLECGMGGRDDATNIVRNKICCVITSVSFDHMQYLGNTLGEIASVKAGIITSDCPVVVYDSDPEVVAAVSRRCDETGSNLYAVGTSDVAAVSDMKIGLRGTFQKENAAVAKKVLEVIGDRKLIPGYHTDENVIAKAFENVRWPFRFEMIKDFPKVFVDGAHNADAAIKLRDTIKSELAGYDTVIVMGMFSDKEYEKVIKTLAEVAVSIVATETPQNARALPADKLAECAKKYCSNVILSESIEDAYKKACDVANASSHEAAIVACGSLSYLNDFRKCVI